MQEKRIKPFLSHLQNVCGASLNTLKAYQRDLNLYQDYLKTLPPKTSRTSWDSLYIFMHKKGLGTRSQARVISCLKSYFKFLQSKGIPTPDFSRLASPSFKNSLPKCLYEESFLKLLEASSQKAKPPVIARNRLSLQLLFGLGCRVSELIAIDTTDYQLAPPWIKLKGKGEKERMIPLPQGHSRGP